MPINSEFTYPYEEGAFLHVICKSVGDTLLFKNDKNRLYFLKKYADYTHGYFQTFAYILLNNHVHILIRCSEQETLDNHLNRYSVTHLKKHQRQYLSKEISYREALEFQFKDFLISYAMAYNKENNRVGALFVKQYKRIHIQDDNHLTQTIVYIHLNSLKHKILTDYENYKWSSYLTILSEKPTLIKRNEVLNWFGGKEYFINTHKQMMILYD